MSDELKVNPSGCPGPIHGTRIWRCDGENCVYGPNQYASCKQAVIDRGYTLRITSDLVEEMRQQALLKATSAETQLKDKEAILDAQKQYIKLQNEERQYLLETLAESRGEQEGSSSYAEATMQELVHTTEQLYDSKETLNEAQNEVERLLCENAALRDELTYCKQLLEEPKQDDSLVGQIAMDID